MRKTRTQKDIEITKDNHLTILQNTLTVHLASDHDYDDVHFEKCLLHFAQRKQQLNDSIRPHNVIYCTIYVVCTVYVHT